jgi:hypothetical protein
MKCRQVGEGPLKMTKFDWGVFFMVMAFYALIFGLILIIVGVTQ